MVEFSKESIEEVLLPYLTSKQQLGELSKEISTKEIRKYVEDKLGLERNSLSGDNSFKKYLKEKFYFL